MNAKPKRNTTFIIEDASFEEEEEGDSESDKDEQSKTRKKSCIPQNKNHYDNTNYQEENFIEMEEVYRIFKIISGKDEDKGKDKEV